MRCDQCLFFKPEYEYEKYPSFEEHQKEGRSTYWIHPDDREGTCHRYPAVIDTAGLSEWQKSDDYDGSGAESHYRFWLQPIMRFADWCGEFKKRA